MRSVTTAPKPSTTSIVMEYRDDRWVVTRVSTVWQLPSFTNIQRQVVVDTLEQHIWYETPTRLIETVSATFSGRRGDSRER